MKTESVIDFPKKTLCPDVWEKVVAIDGMSEVWQLKYDVREKLLIIATTLCPTATMIHVTGSITSNQYTKNADIDLHFKSDKLEFSSNDEVDQHNKKIRDIYQKAGIQHIGEHLIEVYYQDNKFQDYMSVGCYDVLNDRWLVGPELTDQSFNPYSEYYAEVHAKSEALAQQIRNMIFSIYEIAVVLKKNIGTEFQQNVRQILVTRLEEVQKLYDIIRQSRKVYSSPTSAEEALRWRSSRKWKIADASFKLFDKYGYTAILKQFIQDAELMSSTDDVDVEVVEDILSTVKNYISNADKLAEKELFEDQLMSKNDKKYRLWVDDIRKVPNGYVWIKSVDEFIKFVDDNGVDSIEVVDLDHDAGDFHDNGGDYIRCLDYLEFIEAKDMKIRLHTDNPVGRQNMQRIIRKNHWKEIFDIIDEDQQLEEGAMSNALLAALLAVPGILSAKQVQQSIDKNQRYEMIVKDMNNSTRMIGKYSAFQAANIIARTLYAEARNDGEVGMKAVASVIFNRADGKKELFTNACLKHMQFSCWNKFTKEEADPKNFKIKIPSSVKGNAKNERLWKEAMAIAADMLADAFTPTTKANTYFNPKTANPKWASDLLNSKMIGSHKFGTIKNHSAFV